MKKIPFNINTKYFKTIDSNEKAYWLGFICADGCIHKTESKFSLISKDIEVIENFIQATDCKYKLQTVKTFDKRTKKEYTSYRVSISNKEFREYIINQGVTSNKTDKLEMPNIDEKYYSYFFAGLFDGDGSVQEYVDQATSMKVSVTKKNHYIKMNKCRISLISTKEMLSMLQQYLLKEYLIVPIELMQVSKNKSNVWKMYLYKDAKKFLDWIYMDKTFPYLTRKYNKYTRLINI